MSIIIFIVILVILIIVHELGHFIIAKKCGIRVDEFGLGYPPRAVTLFEKGGTKYTLNWIPFGGFVKIFGENPDDESINGPDKVRSFVHKPRWAQALVLVAGVAFNIIFAWLLISIGFMSGLPTPANYAGAGEVVDARLIITSVSKDSPAQRAGLRVGDAVISLQAEKGFVEDLTPADAIRFIELHQDEPIALTYTRGEEKAEITATPEEGVVGGKKALGISMDMIGTLELPWYSALWEGAKTTVNITIATVKGLAVFIGQSVVGRGDFTQVAGPVGIVGLVGDVSQLGFIYLLSFTAFISINLAVINLIPFPALDGGRLLFVLIESIKRSPINPKIANALNAVGFTLLIILMLVVTFNDIIKLI